MKKLICILVSIFLLIPMCVGCAQDGYTDDSTKDVTDTSEVATEDMTDTSEVATEDVTEPDVTEPDVTEPDVTEPDVTEPDVSIQLPPCYNVEGTESFESLGKFMDRLHALETENASNIGDVKLSGMIRTLHGLENLNTHYGEDAWVEWIGGFNYAFYFSRGGGVNVAFHPFLSEADLKIEHYLHHKHYTYSFEQLAANPNISNLQKQPLETELGTAYECTFDSTMHVGQKLQRFEYTDMIENITYELTRRIDPDGVFDALLFVFDGENSFYIYTDDPNLTISAATKLSSVPVK